MDEYYAERESSDDRNEGVSFEDYAESRQIEDWGYDISDNDSEDD